MPKRKVHTPRDAAEKLLGCVERILETFDELSEEAKLVTADVAYEKADASLLAGRTNDATFYTTLADFLRLRADRQPRLRMLLPPPKLKNED